MTRITVGVVSVHVFKRKSVEAGGSQLLVSEVRLPAASSRASSSVSLGPLLLVRRA